MDEGEARGAVAAGIICSLRAGDLAGWTPPWRGPPSSSAAHGGATKAWPAVTRGKRSRSSRPGSAASPLDYSGGSGACTSGGEVCSPPAARAEPVPTAPASSSAKVGGLVGGRRPSTTVPVPAGQRSRKKMRLPEVQLLVRSLAAENDGLREEMQSLRRACEALSEENGTLETRLEHSSSSKRKRIGSEDEERRQTSGFVLPDLNIPAHCVTDGSATAAAP